MLVPVMQVGRVAVLVRPRVVGMAMAVLAEHGRVVLVVVMAVVVPMAVLVL